MQSAICICPSALKNPWIFSATNWREHTEKLKKGFSTLTEEDICVLCGDLSWAMGLEDAREDFLFINSLPGRKIILKGNHDYWWNTAAKMGRFFLENGIDSIDIRTIIFMNTARAENMPSAVPGVGSLKKKRAASTMKK